LLGRPLWRPRDKERNCNFLSKKYQIFSVVKFFNFGHSKPGSGFGSELVFSESGLVFNESGSEPLFVRIPQLSNNIKKAKNGKTNN
jgi:hypothetical protein